MASAPVPKAAARTGRPSMLRGIDTLIGYDFQSFNGRDDVLLIAPTDEQVHAGIFQLRTNDVLSSKARIAPEVCSRARNSIT